MKKKMIIVALCILTFLLGLGSGIIINNSIIKKEVTKIDQKNYSQDEFSEQNFENDLDNEKITNEEPKFEITDYTVKKADYSDTDYDLTFFIKNITGVSMNFQGWSWVMYDENNVVLDDGSYSEERNLKPNQQARISLSVDMEVDVLEIDGYSYLNEKGNYVDELFKEPIKIKMKK